MADEYFGIFPTILFSCYDIVTPMHFILSLNNTSEDEKNQLTKIMQHCGAELSFDLSKVNDHTIVIVDHDEVVSVSCPAFKLNYILDCVEHAKVQDISNSQYRQASTSHLAKDAYLMDVVYFRTNSWSSLLSEFEKIWIDINSLTDNAPCTASDQTNFTTEKPIVIQLESSSESNHSSGCEQQITKNLKKDSAIADLQDELTAGDDTIEEENKRNKEEVGSTGDDTIEEENKKNKEEVGSCLKLVTSPSTSTSKKWILMDDSDSENSDVISQPKHDLPDEQILMDGSESEKSDTVSQPRHHKFNKRWRVIDDSESEESDTNSQPRHSEPNKRSRLPYTREERHKIVKYIADHNEFARVKGREMWCIMERRKVCPSRTWQSMKEHFIKKIIYDLDPYTFLTAQQKKKIKITCF